MYVHSQIEQGKLPVKCPNPTCETPTMVKTDLEALLDEASYARLQKFEWKVIRDTNPGEYIECPNDSCDYFFSRGDVKEVRRHDCPVCSLSWCHKCNMAWHEGFTCAEYAYRERAEEINNTHLEEDDQLEQWAGQAGAKRCSRCKYWVVKNEGCDHMTCRCGYEFHYVCGGKYKECGCPGQ